MLDLETWGTAPGSMIRSVGAVFFDPETGELGDEFYANVSEKSCKKLKLVQDESTIAFWAKPANALANKQLSENQMDIVDVADRFEAFFRKGGKFVWSQGGNFDDPMWSWVYRKLGRESPWKFYDSRCTRTAYSVAQFSPFSIKREGTYHNALDDCKHQVICVSMAHKKIRGKLV